MDSADYDIAESVIQGLGSLWWSGEVPTIENLRRVLGIDCSKLERFLSDNDDVFVKIHLGTQIGYYTAIRPSEAMRMLAERRNILKLFEVCMM